MKRWKLRNQAKCPQCSCPIEDKDHIIRCSADSAKAKWNRALIELDNWMQATKTHPQLRQDIIAGLQHWHDGTQPPRVATDASTARAIQDSIGWGMVFEGCLATQSDGAWYLKDVSPPGGGKNRRYT